MTKDKFNKYNEFKRIMSKLSNDDLKAKRQINAYICQLIKKHKNEPNIRNRRDLTSAIESLKRLR